MSGRDGPWGDLFDELMIVIPDLVDENILFFHIILSVHHDSMSSIVMRLSRNYIPDDQILA